MTTIDFSATAATGRRCPQRPFATRYKPIRGAMTAVAAVALALCAISPAPAQASTGNSPMAVTQSIVNRALKIMASKKMPVVQRRRALRNVVEDHFDFTEMSRSALGYHWRRLNPDQRSRFTKLFTAFIEDAYLSKIQNYSGQRVQFNGQTSLGQGYEQISTNIIEPGKSSIAVNYLLLNKSGSWKIYDVTVDAISIIANYRNQFNRVINERGFNQLMADLRSKQQELASLLDG
jgi:phospholipid transport system substrate-binding protein